MKESKKLLQIKLAETSYNDFKKLKDEAGLSTFAELIKYSFVLFRWALDKQKNGYEIYAIPINKNEQEGEKIQLLMPV